ncbi:MAG: efflux RND transporter periplasmic adaptor subunit [Rhodocyclaceae bacterium]|nr:efflux RND transporter periplasmic adaptor subunit [Rhodocyclaceae bacterium]
MTSKRGILLGALGLAALGAGAWFYLGSGTPAKAAKGPVPAIPVMLAKAEAKEFALALDIPGRAEAYENVTLKSRVEGQVLAVSYAEGQRVKKGDILVRLDPADFEARLRQAEANLAKSQAQAAKSRADLERYIALKAKGFVSDEKVGEMRTAAAAAEANARADQAAADLARLQLGYSTVRAPFDGIVGARLVFPGSAVKVNDTALAVVNRGRPLYISFAVAEKHLPQLRAAMRQESRSTHAAVTIPGDAAAPLDAEVRFLDNAVDTTTGTVQLKATLANTDETLTPGQFVNVSLVLETLPQAITVPAEAIQQGQDGAFLFVVQEDGSAVVRKVVVRASQKGVAVIAEGLKAGETVVTDGQLRLTPGAKVKAAGAERPDGKTKGSQDPQGGGKEAATSKPKD